VDWEDGLQGGLSSFLGGTIDQKTKAVFDSLAVGQGFVHKSALQKFLKPFVWCMVPQEAEVLRPILLSQVTEDIFADISITGKDSISEQEMTRWLHKGQYGSPHQKMLSMTIAERAAMSIAMAVTVAWERYETKQKLRTYGQQTWQEEHGRSQYLTDVGAYRYTAQHASNVMSKASHAASSSASASLSMFSSRSEEEAFQRVFSSIAESSSQLLQKAQTWLAEEDDEDDDDSASLAMPSPPRPETPSRKRGAATRAARVWRLWAVLAGGARPAAVNGRWRGQRSRGYSPQDKRSGPNRERC